MRTGKYLVASILGGLFAVFTLLGTYAEPPRVILVTGFEPFGGDVTNGSWEAVQNLDGKHFGSATVVVAQLPVVWGKAPEKLHELIKANKPVAVISFGQAGEEPVRLETTARNVRENIPDNRGMTPQALQIDAHAALALKTGLSLREIEIRLRAAGIPVRVSHDAGTYLCNDIFYTLMNDPGIADARTIPRGFVHVPPLNAKVMAAGGNAVLFNRKLLQDTAEIIVQTVADTLEATKKSGG